MRYFVEGMSEDRTDKTRGDQESVDEVQELLELGRNHDMYEMLDQLLEKLGVGVDDERSQRSEVDIETVERTTPVKQARKSQKARSRRDDVPRLRMWELSVFCTYFRSSLMPLWIRRSVVSCIMGVFS